MNWPQCLHIDIIQPGRLSNSASTSSHMQGMWTHLNLSLLISLPPKTETVR
jgi:hypothetical protein